MHFDLFTAGKQTHRLIEIKEITGQTQLGGNAGGMEAVESGFLI